MKILITKPLILSDGDQLFRFKRMQVYDIDSYWSLAMLRQGYAIRFAYMQQQEPCHE